MRLGIMWAALIVGTIGLDHYIVYRLIAEQQSATHEKVSDVELLLQAHDQRATAAIAQITRINDRLNDIEMKGAVSYTKIETIEKLKPAQ